MTHAVLITALLSAMGAAQQPARSPNLESALQKWDVTRGTLIAVEPATVQPHAFELYRRNMRARGNGFLWPDPLSPDAPLPEALAYYGRQLIRSGSLTVVAPVDMKVLNTRLGVPDIYSGLPRDTKLRLLEASLTAGQWRQLGSPDGLGAGDLKRDQQALFNGILPDPFAFQKAKVQGTQLQNSGERITLPPEARANVRLRLERIPTFSFPAETRPNSWVRFNDGRPRSEGQEMLILDNAAFINSFRNDAYGAELAYYLPNRLKPGDLRFESSALDVAIPLSQPVTIGALVKRIAAATKVELYADPRAASLPVWTAGRSARAGDLLRAICLAVTGTFRKVGSAFVLTDDLQGLGARVCKIDEWTNDAGMKEAELLATANATLKAQKAEERIDFAEGASLPLPADRLRGIAPTWRSIEEGGRQDFALVDLDPDWQTRLRQEVTRGNSMIRDPQREGATHAGADRVRITVTLNLSYLVPGVGVVDGSQTGGAGWGTRGWPENTAENKKPEAQAGLPEVPIRALHVAPATADEASRFAAEAKQHGFTHLWIELPEKGAKEFLESCVKACREQGIAALAVVRLLYRTSTAKDEPQVADTDLNTLGESASAYQRRRAPLALERESEQWRERFARRGDWLRIDSPELRAAAAKRVTDIAAVPGIAGMVLRDMAPPGYLDSGKGQFPVTREGWDFGLTPAYRLAFLRQEGIDPIDIAMLNMGSFSGHWNLPFFPSEKLQPQFVSDGANVVRMPGRTVVQRWNGFRYEQNREWLAEVFGEIRGKAPSLPVLAEGAWSTDYPMIPARFVHWETANGLPDFSMDVLGWAGPNSPNRLPAIFGFRHPTWRLLNPPGYQFVAGEFPALRKDDPAAFAKEAGRALSASGHPGEPPRTIEGIAIDLTDLPIDRAIEFVRALAP